MERRSVALSLCDGSPFGAPFGLPAVWFSRRRGSSGGRVIMGRRALRGYTCRSAVEQRRECRRRDVRVNIPLVEREVGGLDFFMLRVVSCARAEPVATVTTR